ncbi:MAG: HYR domain-containing protein [Bacteroidales bacterium]|nr:HYR domain-containing protein [Bacteroidales bacterium]
MAIRLTTNGVSSYPAFGIGLTADGVSPAVNAVQNYWGSVAGPFHATLNTCGTGNAVQGNVLFNPWYTDAAMTVLNGLPALTLSAVPDYQTIIKTPVVISETITYPDLTGYDPAVLTDAKITTTTTFPVGVEVTKLIYTDGSNPAVVIPISPAYNLAGLNQVYLSDILATAPVPLVGHSNKVINWQIYISGATAPSANAVSIQSVSYLTKSGCNTNLGSPSNFNVIFNDVNFTPSSASFTSCANSITFTETNIYPVIQNIDPSVTTDARILSNLALPSGAIIDWSYNGGSATGSYTLPVGTSNILLSTIVGSGPVPLVNNNSLTDVWSFTIHGAMLEGNTYNLTINSIANFEGTEYTYNTRTADLIYYNIPVLTIVNPATVCYPTTVDITTAGTTAGSDLPPTTTLTYWNDSGATSQLLNPATVAVSGTYYIMATTMPGGCTDIKPVVVTIDPQPVGGTITPAVSMICLPTNSGTLTLGGNTGSVVRWEVSIDNGTTWSTIANTTTSLTFTDLPQTSLYRAVVHSGVCPGDVYSSIAKVYTGVITTVGSPTACFGSVISVPVTVKSFKDVGSISLHMQYDATKLIPVGVVYDGVPVGWSNVFNMAAGQIIYSGIGPDYTMSDNSVLLTLQFTAAPIMSSGGTTQITFNDVPGENCEYANMLYGWNPFCDSPTASYYFPGTVTVNPLPVCSISGATPVCPISTGNIYTAPSGMTSYSWAISGNGTISGASDEQTVTVTAGPLNNQSFTLTLTIVGPNDCSSTCFKSFVVEDNSNPVITSCGPAQSAFANASCQALVPDFTAGISATDNCTISSVTQSPVAGSLAGLGVNTVIVTVTDEVGNIATCSNTFTVTDNTAPVITCPASVTVNQHQAKDPYATGYATASDNCSGTVVITYDDNRAGLNACNATGVIVRTWTAVDAVGNSISCTQNITVVDMDDPIAVCPSDITANNDPGNCSAVVAFSPDASDFGFLNDFENPAWLSGNSSNQPSTDWNNSNSTLSRVTSFGSIIPNPPSTAFGVINSTGLPMGDRGLFSRLGGYNAISNSFGNGFVSSLDIYFDLSDPAVVAGTYGWDLSTAISNQANDHLRDFIFHATAAAGGPILLAADNNTNGSRYSPGFVATLNHATISTSGWYTLKWTFRNNGSGALAVDCQLLTTGGTVLWTETRSAPTDLISTVVGGNRYMWFTVLATDNLAIDNTSLTRKPLISSSPASGTAFAVGTTPVTVTTTDACGHANSCGFNVTVNDNEAPVVTCPVVASSYNADAGQCYASMTFAATATDNCSVANIKYYLGSTLISFPYNFPVGSTTVTAIATDIHGLTDNCDFIVNVVDTQIPVVSCPSVATSYNADLGQCYSSQSFTATATDNCSVANIKYYIGTTEISFPYNFPVGSTSVTVIATDIHGLTGNCSFDVNVVDTQAPAITCPSVLATYNADAGQCYASMSFAATATDNCAVANIKYYIGVTEITFPYNFPVGSTTVNAIVTDVHSLTNNCSFDVNVVDTQDPVVTCPVVASSYIADAGQCYASMSFIATATDNCAVANIKYYIGSTLISFPYNFPTGSTTVTATATDVHGRTNSCNFVINVVDTQLPIITCPGDVTVNQHDAKDPYSTGYATATDNCTASPVITFNDNRNGLTGCNATGVIVRTWTAKDAVGNTSTCTQNITVIDVDDPLVVCPANITVNNDPGNCGAVVTYQTPVSSDFGFFQGFEDAAWLSGAYQNNPSTDWNEYNSLIARVPSTTSGIISKTGGAHAVINSTVLPSAPGDYSGVFSRLGGYYNSFDSGYIVRQDVYINLADAAVLNNTYGFDISCASNNQASSHLRDFVFHAASTATGSVLVAASNNSILPAGNKPGFTQPFRDYNHWLVYL